jgi:hypothetical protein
LFYIGDGHKVRLGTDTNRSGPAFRAATRVSLGRTFPWWVPIDRLGRVAGTCRMQIDLPTDATRGALPSGLQDNQRGAACRSVRGKLVAL